MAESSDNSDIDPSDLDRVEQMLDAASDRESRIFEQMLSRAIEAKDGFVALTTRMGKTGNNGSGTNVPSYAVCHTLDWIGDNILLGSEMPFMRGHINPESGRINVDASISDEISQRAPDWTRQAALAAYLARPERKFGPIIAVVCPEWVNDPKHPNWGKDGRAIASSVEFQPLEEGGRLGRLILDGTPVFALDGQHRVLGIRGLRDVRDRGYLELRSRDGKATGSVIDKEQFQEDFETDITQLQTVLSESLVVEYLPAVVKGETRTEANRRIRSVFIAINSYAKRTDKGENILLEENNGFAIVARRVAVGHKLFKLRDQTSLVDFKRTNIPARGNNYLTTLSSLKEICHIFLKAAAPELVRNWEPKIKGAVCVRPSEKALDSAEELMFEYFNGLGRLPVFQYLKRLSVEDFRGELSRLRDTVKRNLRGAVQKETARNKAHILLRPVGQEILTRAIARLVKNKEDGGCGYTLRGAFIHIKKLDERGRFECSRPSSPWYGVTHSLDTGKILNRNAGWAHDLIVHMVSALPELEEIEISKRWRKARMIDPYAGEWITATGHRAKEDWNFGILPKE